MVLIPVQIAKKGDQEIGIMGDDTITGQGLMEMIPPEACLDKPKAADHRSRPRACLGRPKAVSFP